MKCLCLLCAILIVCCCVPVASAVTYTFERQWGTQGSAIDQLMSPRGIAVGFDQYGDRGERVYVADTYNDRVVRFRTDGTGPIDWDGTDQGGLDPFHRVVDVATTTADFGIDVMAGDFYASDASNRILRFDAAGMRWGAWGSTGTENGKFQSIGGLGIDSSGNIYVADTGNNRTQKFNPVGVFLGTWGSFGTGNGQFNRPTDVAVDPMTGDVYVADAGNHRVQKFTPSGIYIETLTEAQDLPLQSPNYIAIGAGGSVFVTDEGTHTVHMIDTSGNLPIWWGGLTLTNEEGKFHFPQGVAVDSENNVYVVDRMNHRVQKFKPVGNTPPVVSVPDSDPDPILEGSMFTGSGSFVDPDEDDEWTATVDYGDGTGEQGLMLTGKTFELGHQYADDDDDDRYTVTVTVTDKYNGVGTATFDVMVANDAPETTASWTNAPVDEGSAVSWSGFFTDDGADEWTATVDYGDGTSLPLTLNADKTFSQSHVYADNGEYTVTVTVTDDDGGGGAATFDVTIDNVAPAVSASAVEITLAEGDTLIGSGSFTDPGADTWAAKVDYGDGTGEQDLTLTGKTFQLSHLYADDDDDDRYTVTVTVTEQDTEGAVGEKEFEVTVKNVAPTVAQVDVPLSPPFNPVLVNTPVSASAVFTDPGTEDTHTAQWDWDDKTQPTAGTVSGGSVSGTHSYSVPGIYSPSVTVIDKDGGTDTNTVPASIYIVVYDPNCGSATGGGWFDAPAGKAHFAFVSKYKRDATVPDSSVEFSLKQAKLDFKSTSVKWLLIAGPKATYTGVGTLNGAGEYGFLLSAIDDPSSGDKIRMKIWDASQVIYDSQPGAADDADPSTDIGGGSIVIHQ